MIVCLCNGVSDRTIRRVIDDGAQTVDQVSDACRAGGECGGCREFIGDMLESQARAEAPRPRVSLSILGQSPQLA